MSKEKLEKALEENVVEVCVPLYKPFVDFMKDYMAFFGSKQTVEQFCMGLIYNRLKFLHKQLDNFVVKGNKQIDPQAFFERWPHLSLTESIEGEEEET